jgi:hypothetical protein
MRHFGDRASLMQAGSIQYRAENAALTGWQSGFSGYRVL